MAKDGGTVSGDVLTKARHARGDVAMREGRHGGVGFETAQVPIDHYLNRRLITAGEHRAGNRLFKDFSMSGQTPGMTANLDPARGGKGEFSDAQMEARRRWRDAMDAVDLVGRLMLLNVCCYGYWLNEINYLPHRVGVNGRMARFRKALEELSTFYDSLKRQS